MTHPTASQRYTVVTQCCPQAVPALLNLHTLNPAEALGIGGLYKQPQSSAGWHIMMYAALAVKVAVQYSSVAVVVSVQPAVHNTHESLLIDSL